ncbi:MAG TPA: hypothetical protein VEK34_05760 [Methylocella sp.]|nr:hypothetical protein [Methylocella sp.]
MVDIPVSDSEKGGIFSRHRKSVAEADRVAVGTAMAVLTEQTILNNYGVAFPKFMNKVCADLDATVERVKGDVALFKRKMAPEANAKISRLVEKFGIVYAGAMEACKFGVAPWTEERASTAIETVCGAALRRIEQDSTVDTAIENLCASFEQAQQFPVIEKGNSLPPRAASQAKGFRRSEKRQYVAVTHEQLERMIGDKVLTEEVLKRLVAKGIIWMDGDKRVRKVQVSGFGNAKRPRCYCFWYDELLNLRSSIMTPKGRT